MFSYQPMHGIDGPLIIDPVVFQDERGAFFESFSAAEFEAMGLVDPFVQENVSISHTGVLRGMHFQIGGAAQAKMVRVLRGSAFDVLVDLRPGSPTFGKWVAETLSDENHRSLFVPRGFAHGFLALEENTVFHYMVTSGYAPEASGGVRWNDPDLAIAWPLTGEPRLAPRDQQWPLLKDSDADPTGFGRM